MNCLGLGVVCPWRQQADKWIVEVFSSHCCKWKESINSSEIKAYSDIIYDGPYHRFSTISNLKSMFLFVFQFRWFFLIKSSFFAIWSSFSSGRQNNWALLLIHVSFAVAAPPAHHSIPLIVQIALIIGEGREKCAVSSWFIYCRCRFHDHLQPDPVYLCCDGQICKNFGNLLRLLSKHSVFGKTNWSFIRSVFNIAGD